MIDIDIALMRVTEIQRDALRLHDGWREQSARALPLLVHALQADGEALAVATGCSHGEMRSTSCGPACA